MVVINLDLNINVALTVISHIKTSKLSDMYNISHLFNPVMSNISYLIREFLCFRDLYIISMIQIYVIKK